jgi:hypothetical protein
MSVRNAVKSLLAVALVSVLKRAVQDLTTVSTV